MVVQMTKLDHYSAEYRRYESYFTSNWLHPEKSANVQDVFVVDDAELANSYRGRRFEDYRGNSRCRLLYHGTTRACRVGESGSKLKLCRNDSCGLCGILWHSFKRGFARSNGMFGPGIYTTQASSKADVYVMNDHLRSNLHAMLVCKVVCDRPQLMAHADPARTEPDPGYNCIEGLTRSMGGDLNYPETVVYTESALVPIAVIMYTREGWSP